MRAFKSALFGTPGAEDDEKTPRPPQQSQQTQPVHQRSKSESTNSIPIPAKVEPLKPDLDSFANPGSPTKSILVTPGTITNRRKTVSFGEGVVDNEGKRDSHSIKVVKTPPNPSGNLSAQWLSGSADGKPRSKLTQTLLDARDNASKNADASKTSESTPEVHVAARPHSNDDSEPEDITLNLEEPRSESGKYWKTEYDNYRTRTNREIKKLIHYRAIAKSYARKKDTEALRLAESLKEEEEKVAKMEQQVSRLASSFVGDGSAADKERLIQDLTQQTALALQYKQQVTNLRTKLEKQGVVGSEKTETGDSSESDRKKPHEEPPSDELLRTKQELQDAKTKIEEMKRQNPDLSALQNLAHSSEKKAKDLEQENLSLKKTLARVKQEMSRYEGRRKEKENKLKQREAKLEHSIQEYRDRLRTSTQEHRASEDALRKSFDEERRRMQNQINDLKTRVSAVERVERAPTLRSRQRLSFSPRKEYTGVQIYDFAGQQRDHPEAEEEATEDIEAPPSPSPRSKAREARNTLTSTGTLRKHASRVPRNSLPDDEAVSQYLNQVLPKNSLRSRHVTSTVTSTLDRASAKNTSRLGKYAGHTISGGEGYGKRYGQLSENKIESITPERVAAAKSRLLAKTENGRLSFPGKENYDNLGC